MLLKGFRMAESQPKPKQEEKPKAKEQQAANIVRIAGKDIDASYSIERALDEVKGIGYNLAMALANVAYTKLGLQKGTSIGSLSEEKLHDLEALLKDPAKYGIPGFMLNRNKDPDTGASMHLIGTDLIVRTRQDVEEEEKLGTWRGYRHQFGQKVRGQRTRSTGRTGETVGVTKKKAEEELKKAAQEKATGKEAAGQSQQAQK